MRSAGVVSVDFSGFNANNLTITGNGFSNYCGNLYLGYINGAGKIKSNFKFYNGSSFYDGDNGFIFSNSGVDIAKNVAMSFEINVAKTQKYFNASCSISDGKMDNTDRFEFSSPWTSHQRYNKGYACYDDLRDIDFKINKFQIRIVWGYILRNGFEFDVIERA